MAEMYNFWKINCSGLKSTQMYPYYYYCESFTFLLGGLVWALFLMKIGTWPHATCLTIIMMFVVNLPIVLYKNNTTLGNKK